jgi:hypothetical protein
MKKRILVLLSVVALMVVMLAMSVAPAFAKGTYTCTTVFGSVLTGVPKAEAKKFENAGFATCEKEPKT